MKRIIAALCACILPLIVITISSGQGSTEKGNETSIPFGLNLETKSWRIKVISIDYPEFVYDYHPADQGTEGSGRIIEAPLSPTDVPSNYIAIKDDKRVTFMSFSAVN